MFVGLADLSRSIEGDAARRAARECTVTSARESILVSDEGNILRRTPLLDLGCLRHCNDGLCVNVILVNVDCRCSYLTKKGRERCLWFRIFYLKKKRLIADLREL